jgi:hypothetical protein
MKYAVIIVVQIVIIVNEMPVDNTMLQCASTCCMMNTSTIQNSDVC